MGGDNLPCPPNPWTITTILMQTTAGIPILIQDTFTEGACSSSGGGQSCLQMIEDGILTNNTQEVIDGILCLTDQGFFGADVLLRKIATHQVEKTGGIVEQYIDRLGEELKGLLHNLFGNP
jgi:hypothetical protein